MLVLSLGQPEMDLLAELAMECHLLSWRSCTLIPSIRNLFILVIILEFDYYVWTANCVEFTNSITVGDVPPPFNVTSWQRTQNIVKVNYTSPVPFAAISKVTLDATFVAFNGTVIHAKSLPAYPYTTPQINLLILGTTYTVSIYGSNTYGDGNSTSTAQQTGKYLELLNWG